MNDRERIMLYAHPAMSQTPETPQQPSPQDSKK